MLTTICTHPVPLTNLLGVWQEYSSGKPVTIHYPPSQYLDDSTRRSVLADLPGLRLPKSVLLTREQRGEGSSAAASLRFRNSSHRLMLRIHNKVLRLLGMGV